MLDLTAPNGTSPNGTSPNGTSPNGTTPNGTRADSRDAALRRLSTGPRHPAPRAGRRPDWRKWWARLLVLLMVAGAAYGGLRLVEYRTAEQNVVDLGTFTLTARATPVSTTRGGVVRTTTVEAGERVATGDRLGTVLVTTVTGNGRIETDEISVRAPSDGLVVADPMPVGASVQPGQAFVEIYDPARMTLVGDVRIDVLGEVSTGMPVTLTGPEGTTPVTATVDRVAPRVEGEQDGADAGSLRLVLTPRDTAQVGDLVPGYQLDGTVVVDPDGPRGGVLGGA